MPGIQEQYEEQTIVLEVPAGYDEHLGLDRYITGFVENATRSKVAQAIKQQKVLVNGSSAKTSYQVQAGDRIECRISRPKPVELIPEPIPIDVLYEDDALIIVDKPADMVVHPAFGHRSGTLVNALLHHVGYESHVENPGLSMKEAGPKYEGDPTIRPGLVHRLDKDTTGTLLVAKTESAHEKLARQLSARTMSRQYEAVVLGVPDEEEGVIETHLGRDPRDRKRMAVVEPPNGKRAVTKFKVVESFVHASRVLFRLETGRTHQIRVHALHMGHPVLGDPAYGGRNLDKWQKGSEGRRLMQKCLNAINRQALHALSIGFQHPVRNTYMEFESALPDDMQQVLDTLRAGFLQS